MRRRIGNKIYETEKKVEESAPSRVTPEAYAQLQLENALRKVFGIELTPVMIERRG